MAKRLLQNEEKETDVTIFTAVKTKATQLHSELEDFKGKILTPYLTAMLEKFPSSRENDSATRELAEGELYSVAKMCIRFNLKLKQMAIANACGRNDPPAVPTSSIPRDELKWTASNVEESKSQLDCGSFFLDDSELHG